MKRNRTEHVFDSFWDKTRLISQVLVYSVLLSQNIFVSYAVAAPTGGNVVGGTGTINQSGLNTTINQNTQNMAIDWQSYNVNIDERVQYIQPNTSSIALNRILSNSASQIHGRIDANGQVILVNPNGVFFSPTASINVGGLIASGLDIKPTDFMNGNYIFDAVIGTDGAVINSGIINASLGGNVALIGKQVKNEGLISAKLGTVTLAAGKQVVLTFDNGGILGVKISKAILQSELGVDPAVLNSGDINAEGGRVLLTASVSQDIFSQAVNSNGIDQAISVVANGDGTFSLGGGADVVNSGIIDVSTTEVNQAAGQIVLLGENVTSSGVIKADAANGNGGEIELHAQDTTLLTQNSVTSARSVSNGKGGVVKVLGNKVGLFDQSKVDVSGANGGGVALIGGGQQGLNPNIRNADFIYLGEDTQVNADALDSGNGGKIITFASDTARIHGGLFARGGINGGDGGFIETSGLWNFQILKAPDVSSSFGQGGEWLIDPYNITIVSGGNGSTNNIDTITDPFTSTGIGATLGVNLITAALGGGDVTITTSADVAGTDLGDIEFLGTDLSYTGNRDSTLTLNAVNNIDTNGRDITSNNGLLNIVFYADFDGNGTGNVIINDSQIRTNGGNFTAYGADFTSSRASGGRDIQTDGGNVNLYMTGNINIGAEIITNGGDFTVGYIDRAIPANSIIPLSFTNDNANGRIDTRGTTDGSVSITTRSAIAGVGANLGGIRTGSGDMSVTANGGTIIQSSADELRIDGITTLSSSSNITLDNVDNEFNTVTTTTAVDLTLWDTDDIRLGATTITGNLVVTDGGDGGDNITQVATAGEGLTIGGASTFTSGNNVILTNGDNNFIGAVAITADQARITDSNALLLGNITLDGQSGETSRFIAGGNITQLALTRIHNQNTGTITSFDAGDNNITLNNFADTRNNDSNTNDFAIVTISNANNVSLYENDWIVFGDVATTGNLTVVAGINADGNGNYITDQGGATISVAGTATLISQTFNGTGLNGINRINRDIVLDSSNNNFNLINIINARDVTLVDNTGSVGIQGTVTRNLKLTANGTNTTGNVITNSGGLSVSGDADFVVRSGESIALTNVNNVFTNDPTFDTSNDGNINHLAVTDTTDITLQNNLDIDGNLTVTGNNVSLQDTTVGGDLVLSATAITGSVVNQAGGSTLTVAGTSMFDAATITFNNSGNDFQGAVNVNKTGATVFLRDDTGGIQLGGSTANSFVSSSLSVTSNGGDISQGSSIATGAMTLDSGNDDIIFQNTANDFSGNINIISARDAFLVDANGLTIESAAISRDLSLQAVMGNVTLGTTATTDIDVGRNLIINAGNSILETANVNLSVGNIAQLTAGTGAFDAITLNTQNNDFNVVNIISGYDVRLRDNSGSIGLQGTVSGALTVVVDETAVGGGDIITNPGALIVTGAANFTVSDGQSISLDNAGNTFSTDPVFTGNINNLSVTDSTALTLQNNLDLSGNLTLNAAQLTFNGTTIGGDLMATTTGGIGQTISTAINVSGTSDLNGGSGGISLTQANVFGSTVTLTTTSTDLVNNPSDAAITAVGLITLGSSSIVGGLDVTANSVVQVDDGVAGTNDGITVANTATFTVADNSSITLGNVDNQFNGVSFFATTAGAFLDSVTISNNGALDLQNLSLTNDLTATAIGNIINSGTLVVNGDTRISGNDITLGNANNDFNNIAIVSGNTVFIRDMDSINFIETSSVNVDLTVSAGGSITDDATSTISVINGVANFISGTAQTDNVLLDSGSHDFNDVRITSGGNVIITDINDIRLGASNITGSLTVIADSDNTGAINNIGSIGGVGEAILVGGDATFTTSTGSDITLDNTGNRFTGSLFFTGAAGALNDVTLYNNTATVLGAVDVSNNLFITSMGSITDTATSTISVGNNTSLTATDQDIFLTNSNNDFSSVSVLTRVNDITLIDANALNITGITALGTVKTESNGLTVASITADSIDLDAGNGGISSSGGDLIAGSLRLRANTGIGALSTQVSTLDVINNVTGTGSGEIIINNTGPVTVANLVNYNNSGSREYFDSITFTNNGNVIINNIDADYDYGKLVMTIPNGSVFGIDRRIGQGYLNIPDITAREAYFTVEDGDFGTLGRSIVMNIKDFLYIDSNVSSVDFLGGPQNAPGDYINNSDIQISIFDSIANLSGQRLIEVESLAEIDPAIFTEVRNYYQDDIALKLPRDQLYDEDIEKEKEREQ